MKAIPQRDQKLLGLRKTLTENFKPGLPTDVTLTQGQTDRWVGVFLKALLLVNIQTKYESHPSKGSKVIRT